MTIHRRNRIQARVMVAEYQIVPPGAVTTILVRHGLRHDDGQDLLFEGKLPNLEVFACVTDAKMTMALVRNSTNKSVVVPRNQKIGTLVSLEDDCRLAKLDDISADEAVDLAANRQPDPTTANRRPARALRGRPPGKLHDTGATIHDDAATLEQLQPLLTEFAEVFLDKGFTNLPKEQWMRIPLKPDWENLAPKKCKAYPVNSRDDAVIEETVENLKSGDKLFRTNDHVPFAFSVFVVWQPNRTAPSRVGWS
jgi:hypothetical protein